MRGCVGKGVRTHVKGLDEGEGDSASELNRRAQWSEDACGLLKGLRRKGQPIACSAWRCLRRMVSDDNMRLLGVDPGVEIGAPRQATEAATTSGCTG